MHLTYALGTRLIVLALWNTVMVNALTQYW